MSKKNIIGLIVIIILFIGASMAIYFLTKEDKELSINKTELINRDDYTMFENNKEVEDEITITPEKNSSNDHPNPKEITVIEKKLIKENESIELEETIIDKNIENKINLNETDENTNINNSNSTNNSPKNNDINKVTPKSADEVVLEYVNTVERHAHEGVIHSLKSGFITVVDFLFYNGEIAGHTFNELSTTAKLEVLKVALWIDDKIEQVFPGYKQTIGNGTNKVYTSVKNLIVGTYLDITTSICENHSDLCERAKNDFQSLKKSFGFTWDLIKDLANSGLDKLENWYEIWREK